MTMLFLVGTLAGVFFEQREVEKAMGYSGYKEYRRLIPNVIWPDWGRVLVMSEKEVEQVRRAVLKACAGETNH